MNLRPIASSVVVVSFFASALIGCIGSTSSSGESEPRHESPTPPPGQPDGGPDPVDPVNPISDEASCGVAPVADPDGGVVLVGDGGVTMTTSVPVGSSIDFTIDVQDTADVSETILSGGTTAIGFDSDPFSIDSTFPIAVPAGQPAQITVRFAPTAPGTYTGQLNLQTMKMGVSTITVQAVATE
jgi:hypothetical protein